MTSLDHLHSPKALYQSSRQQTPSHLKSALLDRKSFGDDDKLSDSLRSQIDSLREQLRISRQIYEEELNRTIHDKEKSEAKLIAQLKETEADWRSERLKREQLDRELEHVKKLHADEVRALQTQKAVLTQEMAGLKEQYFSTVSFQTQLEKSEKIKLETRVAEAERTVREPLEAKVKDLELEIRLAVSQNDSLKLDVSTLQRRLEEEQVKCKKLAHKLAHTEEAYAKAKKKLQRYREKTHSMRTELRNLREDQAEMKVQMMDLEALVHKRAKLRR